MQWLSDHQRWRLHSLQCLSALVSVIADVVVGVVVVMVDYLSSLLSSGQAVVLKVSDPYFESKGAMLCRPLWDQQSNPHTPRNRHHLPNFEDLMVAILVRSQTKQDTFWHIEMP
ncbi:hypothetical protein Droror1_Dr00008544 [Drosera rotundifolia]